MMRTHSQKPRSGWLHRPLKTDLGVWASAAGLIALAIGHQLFPLLDAGFERAGYGAMGPMEAWFWTHVVIGVLFITTIVLAVMGIRRSRFDIPSYIAFIVAVACCARFGSRFAEFFGIGV